jgi:uncharacterized surface protein with fasciclin (FAS1) repeats
VYAGDLPS